MREALEQKLRLQQMTRELQIARNIQSSMLPPCAIWVEHKGRDAAAGLWGAESPDRGVQGPFAWK
jgi:hypothetical protein